jgi:excisionase family DNA binding protein
MEGTPEQLSLPLFEPDPVERLPQPSKPRPAKRKSRRPVASGRGLTQPAELRAATALLTTQEAAELLHVHARTVQRLVERGELIAVHLGAAVRFDPGDVADLTARLKRRTAEPTRSHADSIRRNGAARTSFSDRLRSQNREHRADQA